MASKKSILQQNVLSAVPLKGAALKRPRRFENGQALIETSLVMGAMIATLITTVPVIALAAARMWVGHSLYERLRCELSQSTTTERYQCDSTLKKRIEPLWWGRLNSTQIYVSNDGPNREAEVNAQWCNTNARSLCPNNAKLEINLKIRENEIKDLHSRHSSL